MTPSDPLLAAIERYPGLGLFTFKEPGGAWECVPTGGSWGWHECDPVTPHGTLPGCEVSGWCQPYFQGVGSVSADGFATHSATATIPRGNEASSEQPLRNCRGELLVIQHDPATAALKREQVQLIVL